MKGLPKNTIAWLLFCGSLAAPSAWGFETNYDRGRVDFAGRVTDISCSIALNGGQHAGSGNVWLAPVSLAEVHDRGAGAFMKPQPFTLALSNCQLRHDGGAASQDEVRRVSVRWVDGFLLTAVGNENAGYLANTLPMERRIFIWRYRLTIIIRWIRVIKLSRRPAAKSGAFAGKRGQRRPVHLLRWLCFANAEKRHQRADYQLGNVGISL
ncbi:P pilus assembly protein, pilin FimA [Hafnia alvei]|nr:P pilus assembly protein, pilin FimA [Hafnia alvei]